jgi:hypothetical protein
MIAMLTDPPLFSQEQCAPTSGPGREHQIAVQMNRYWVHFAPYADASFVKNSQDAMAALCKFSEPGPERSHAFDALHSQWWEMFVGSLMIESGITLVPRRDWKSEWGTAGPDFQAKHDGKTIWVECIAPGPGCGNDAVPVPNIPLWDAESVDDKDSTSQDPPSREMMLRLTGAIHDKRNQYTKHCQAGIIVQPDAYVIAVSLRCVSPLVCLEEDKIPPLPAQAVFGLGDLQSTYDLATQSWTTPRLTRKTSIRKSTGARINTNIFADGSAKEVSGVLYSSIDSANVGTNPRAKVLYMANHTAANPLPRRWIREIRTCGVTTNSDGALVFDHESPDILD